MITPNQQSHVHIHVIIPKPCKFSTPHSLDAHLAQVKDAAAKWPQGDVGGSRTSNAPIEGKNWNPLSDMHASGRLHVGQSVAARGGALTEAGWLSGLRKIMKPAGESVSQVPRVGNLNLSRFTGAFRAYQSEQPFCGGLLFNFACYLNFPLLYTGLVHSRTAPLLFFSYRYLMPRVLQVYRVHTRARALYLLADADSPALLRGRVPSLSLSLPPRCTSSTRAGC